MSNKESITKDTLETEFKTLFYSIENNFPNNDFCFNKVYEESKARVVLPKIDKIVEVELDDKIKSIEQSITEAIWTIKQITKQLDA